jgi:hypothetical protein
MYDAADALLIGVPDGLWLSGLHGAKPTALLQLPRLDT